MWPETVRKEDCRIEFTRGSGKGGQNRNKRDTACRITHLPTGLVGWAQDERTQGANRRLAIKRLFEQLIPIMKREAVKMRFAAGNERVRTYHEPDNRVVDEAVPGRVWQFDDVLNGKALDEIIQLRCARLDEA